MITFIPIKVPELRQITYADGQRFYCDRQMNFYPSWTTFLGAALPTDKYLKKWLKNNSAEYIEDVLDRTSFYGTCYHVLVEYFDENGFIYTETAKKMLSEKFSEDEKFDIMCKHLASWVKFRRDRDVTILASEVPLVSKKYNLAGTIDKVVEMKFGQKKVRAIIDIKSGENSYLSHALQLHGYMRMWNECYRDYPVTHCFNFHPKDWRNEPTYELINQTDHEGAEDLDDYIAIYNRKKTRPRGKVMWASKISLNDDLTKLTRYIEPEVFYQSLFE